MGNHPTNYGRNHPEPEFLRKYRKVCRGKTCGYELRTKNKPSSRQNKPSSRRDGKVMGRPGPLRKSPYRWVRQRNKWDPFPCKAWAHSPYHKECLANRKSPKGNRFWRGPSYTRRSPTHRLFKTVDSHIAYDVREVVKAKKSRGSGEGQVLRG